MKELAFQNTCVLTTQIIRQSLLKQMQPVSNMLCTG